MYKFEQYNIICGDYKKILEEPLINKQKVNIPLESLKFLNYDKEKQKSKTRKKD
jgi:hypothetical protein